jgi:hypothetical protein
VGVTAVERHDAQSSNGHAHKSYTLSP